MMAQMVTLDLMEPLAPLEFPVPVATPEPLATPGHPGQTDPLGTKVRPVPRDPPESLGALVHLAPRDPQDRKEVRVFLEIMDKMDKMDNQEYRVLLDQWAHQEHLDLSGHRAPRAPWVPGENKVPRGSRDPPELTASLVTTAWMDPLEALDQGDPQATLELMVHLGLRAPSDLLAHQD